MLEILVATSILVMILVIVLGMVDQLSKIWRSSSERIEAFQSARLGFDLMTRNLRQATLNPYLDYEIDPTSLSPRRYLRKSDLRFLLGPAGKDDLPGVPDSGQAVFFQAPASYTLDAANCAGLDSLINTSGYYIGFTRNTALPPHVETAVNPYRYRLIQLLVPAEKKNIYDPSMKDNEKWFTDYVDTNSRIVADNIIALILRPQAPGSTSPDIITGKAYADYTYDSALNVNTDPQPVYANQLPPIVQVTMVAIDESSAKHIDAGPNQPNVITSALAGKFQNAANYTDDLDKLEKALMAARIRYRVFSSAIPIRESLWSK
ncbi:MAG: hypothetical protein PHQ12_00765 [Chthoniobacteraceae bacterium]|nr:hypothetical protein [Chthoniobacteraceae bacterium]